MSRSNGADPPTEDEERVEDYRNRTRRIAFFAGTAIGVIVAALGIRLLELFVDPAVFESLPSAQQTTRYTYLRGVGSAQDQQTIVGRCLNGRGGHCAAINSAATMRQ